MHRSLPVCSALPCRSQAPSLLSLWSTGSCDEIDFLPLPYFLLNNPLVSSASGDLHLSCLVSDSDSLRHKPLSSFSQPSRPLRSSSEFVCGHLPLPSGGSQAVPLRWGLLCVIMDIASAQRANETLDSKCRTVLAITSTNAVTDGRQDKSGVFGHRSSEHWCDACSRLRNLQDPGYGPRQVRSCSRTFASNTMHVLYCLEPLAALLAFWHGRSSFACCAVGLGGHSDNRIL